MIIASIDIGTNTILLLIAEVDLQTLTIKSVLNLQRIPRIGEGLNPGQLIMQNKIEKLFSILIEYNQIIAQYNCKLVLVNATNAFRIASNGTLIVQDIKNKFNLNVNIVPGKEEARLSYLGATSSCNISSKILVIDIGGGSTELIYGKKDKISFIQSYPVGVVCGTERYFKNNPPSSTERMVFTKFIKQELMEITLKDIQPDKVIAIAGTPTTLACINQSLNEYNEDLIEGTKLKRYDIGKIIEILSMLSSQEIKQKYKSIVNGREDVLLAGSQILFSIMDLLNLDEVIVSTKGIRYGAIEDYLIKNFKGSNFGE